MVVNGEYRLHLAWVHFHLVSLSDCFPTVRLNESLGR